MKRRLSIVIVLGLLSSLLAFAQVHADHTDAFTYFIPYPADRLADQFRAAQPPGFVVNGIQPTISISGYRSNSIIYYDHWEDGLEPNIYFPIQNSTEVWGDGDPSNGSPPGIPSDVLVVGGVIALQNLVPVPRNTDVILYDGGDKLVPVGGSIAVTLAAWPDTAGILYAGAWELYPTSRWGTEYVIPVGQNVPRPNGGFTRVGLNVQAVEDGTTVQLDLNADGTFEETRELDEGQQFTQVNGVSAGAVVRSLGGAVQVHIFTGDPASDYQARFYTMLPRSQWTHDYLAPRSSDGDYWLFNPNGAPLTVSVQTSAGTSSISVPANGAARYPPLPAPVLNFPTGARFTSTNGQVFYGVAALDRDQDQDWGYALLPIENLTTQAIIGWAPGNNRPTPDGDESRVYVTAVTTTTVYVDYDNNGTPDNSYNVPPLAEVFITDPDHDLTGARLYTDGVPFIAVWGQDENASPALPSMDLGTNIVPLAASSIQKTYSLVEGGYDCGTVTRGHTIRFRLQAFNDTITDLNNVVVQDTPASGVTYVPNSTTVVGGSPIPDDSSGTPFPLDGDGTIIATIPALGSVSITYDVVIPDSGSFVNEAALSGADPARVTVSIPLRLAGYDVTKTLIDPPAGDQVNPGDVITFGLTITNTGNVTITQLPLQDTFDENYLSFLDASALPDNVATGEIEWNDLTLALGDLPPTTTTTLALWVSFLVADEIPPDVTSTINVALAEGVQDSDGRTQTIICDEASVTFASSVEPPSEPPDEPPSPPQAPPPPSPTPAPVPSPTPAVLFLPETGVGQPPAAQPWLFMAVPVLVGLLAVWAIRRH